MSWAQIDATFETCAAGTSQSPVDVGTSREAELPKLRFDYPRVPLTVENTVRVPLTVENTGHVVEVPIPADSGATLRVGRDTYRLVQFHFHAPSEHAVNGRYYNMEAHLVHRDDATGRLAVVGVFLDETAQSNALLDFVIANAPLEAEEEHAVDATFSATGLFPGRNGRSGRDGDGRGNGSGRVSATEDDYVTYGGSLTTPPCSEGVRWMVLEEPGAVSAASVERHHEVVGELPGYDGYGFNSRPVQPLNGRSVLRAD